MLHARSDYDAIQDPSGKIPDDEPVMLFRAQDALAPAALMHYATLLEANKADPAMVRSVRSQAMRMADYARGKSKIPDMPEGSGRAYKRDGASS